MISTIQNFEESIAFELYLLEKLCPAIEQHEGASIDLRGSRTAAAVSVCITESLSGAAIGQIKDQLMPLMFGAGWKVLDLLLELALHSAGFRPKRQEWSINEKQQYALTGLGDRAVLSCSQPVWVTLSRLYANTVEHRHSLVHRTARVNSVTGAMEGFDRNQRPLQQLTRDHQIALAKVAALAARGVVGGGIDRRSEDHLKYQLDQLAIHTGLPTFGTSGSIAPVEIKLSLVLENDALCLDMTGVLERAKKIFPSVAHFNVVVEVPDGSGLTLFGYAENCPQNKSLIDLTTLPSWLEYR